MSPSLDEANAKAPSIAGRWTLDRQASDDVRSRLVPLFEKKDRRWRKMEDEFEERSGERVNSPRAESRRIAPPEGQSNMQWLQEQRQQDFRVLISTLTPATRIEVQQTPKQLRFSSDKGEGSRTLVPGDVSALFVGIGGFDVRSGWRKSTFVIDSRGTGENGMHMLEQYTLLESGSTLEEVLVAKIPEFGKQTFRFVYRRNGPSD